MRANVGTTGFESRPGWLVPGGRSAPLPVAVALPPLQLFRAVETCGVRRARETAGVFKAEESAGIKRASP